MCFFKRKFFSNIFSESAIVYIKRGAPHMEVNRRLQLSLQAFHIGDCQLLFGVREGIENLQALLLFFRHMLQITAGIEEISKGYSETGADFLQGS